MKTYLTCGFLLTLCNFLVTLILFICGMHSDAAKLPTAEWVGGLVGLAVAISFIVGGIRARRSAAPATREFTYGQALGAGCLVQLFASLLGILTNYLYFAVINPNFTDLIVQSKLDKLQARGISGDQLDRAEQITRMFSGPLAMTLSGFIGTMIIGTIIALVAAAFLKRAADENAIPAAS